jgi:hypothetical protein
MLLRFLCVLSNVKNDNDEIASEPLKCCVSPAGLRRFRRRHFTEDKPDYFRHAHVTLLACL